MAKLKVHFAPRSTNVTPCGRAEVSVQDTRNPEAVTCGNCLRTHRYREALLRKRKKG